MWFNYRTWKYRNTATLFLSLVVFYFLSSTGFTEQAVEHIGAFGYFGAFMVGIFFVSIFTVAPASVVLYYLAQHYNPGAVALAAGFGAMIGDYAIFKYLQDGVFRELAPLYEKLGGGFLNTLFHTPYFSWLLPFVGAAIIASPLPDELGIGLLGASQIRPWQFLLLTFALNTTGILIIVAFSDISQLFFST